MTMNIDHLVGREIGQYQLEELLGSGAMGAVYRAHQHALERAVAVKVLPQELASKPEYMARFNREAKIAASLEHPHIVPLHDYGTQDGITYVVMRLLTGGTLAQRLNQRAAETGTLPSLHETGIMLREVASALDYAHRKGVVHRDIKPNNIMFDGDGTAYIVDFGIARLLNSATAITSGQTVFGTPHYMPPEQWRDEDLGPETDQYALAVVIYSMLAGQPPFESETSAGLMYKHLNDTPPSLLTFNPNLPEPLDNVLRRALAKKTSDRFLTVTAFSHAYDSAIARVPERWTGFFTFPVDTTVDAFHPALASADTRTVRSDSRPFVPDLPEPDSYLADEALGSDIQDVDIPPDVALDVPQVDIPPDDMPDVPLVDIPADNALDVPDPVPVPENFDGDYVENEADEITEHTAPRAYIRPIPPPMPSAPVPDTKEIVPPAPPLASPFPMFSQPAHTGEEARRRRLSPLVLGAIAGLVTLALCAGAALMASQRSGGGVERERLDTAGEAGNDDAQPTLSEAVTLADAQPTEATVVAPLPVQPQTELGVPTDEDADEAMPTMAPVDETASTPTEQQVAQNPTSPPTQPPATQNPTSAPTQQPTVQVPTQVINANDLLASPTPLPGAAASPIPLDPQANNPVPTTQLNLQPVNPNDAPQIPATRVAAAPLPNVPAVPNAPDGGARIAAANAGSIAERAAMPHGVEPVRGLAFSPSGDTLFSGAADGSIYLWTRDGTSRGTLFGGGGVLYGLALNPDGTLLASAHEDGSIRLWDWQNAALVATLTGHTGAVRGVAFSPDGRLVASGSEDNTARVWDVTTGAEIGLVGTHNARVLSVAFNADGTQLGTASEDGVVRVFDITNGQLVQQFSGGGSMRSVAFNPAGGQIAGGMADGTIGIWDVTTGEQTALLQGHDGEVWTVAYSPDGSLLASGGRDNTARLWDMTTQTQAGVVTGHGGWVLSVAFSPDGALLATGSGDGSARLWSAST